MKIQIFIISILGLLALTSCRSSRSLLSNSAPSATASAKNKVPVKREFLNGIEVTPGFAVSSKHKTNSSDKNTETVSKSKERRNNKDGMMSGSIETAYMLQLKYAIATDATVEKLTNIPLLETIDKWWGTKYCMGGSTDNCIDCSAFAQIVMRDVYQQSLPRTSQEQYAACERIELEDLHEGDLVFFNTGGKDISHVGIYLLNNKFVHAATSGGVMISDLNDKYWQPKFRGAGRVGR